MAEEMLVLTLTSGLRHGIGYASSQSHHQVSHKAEEIFSQRQYQVSDTVLEMLVLTATTSVRRGRGDDRSQRQNQESFEADVSKDASAEVVVAVVLVVNATMLQKALTKIALS